MSRLHLRQHAPDHEHRVIRVTPESAGWEYVGFDLYKLDAGETARGETGDREVCLVFISGKAAVTAGDEDFGSVGARMSPFEGKPWSVYVPAGASWTLTAETPCEIAACSSPGAAGSCPPRVVGPDSHDVMTRGKGNNIRYVTDIINETDPADSLLVVEVITPAGNASSYPPHKHDRDQPPEETLLEETYYHRVDPPTGFGLQRVYTDDRSLDESFAFGDRDTILVPRGYHTVSAPPGCRLYYLNVMAGPVRSWAVSEDREIAAAIAAERAL